MSLTAMLEFCSELRNSSLCAQYTFGKNSPERLARKGASVVIHSQPPPFLVVSFFWTHCIWQLAYSTVTVICCCYNTLQDPGAIVRSGEYALNKQRWEHR